MSDKYVGKTLKSKNSGDYEVIERINSENYLIRFLETGYETNVQPSKFKTGSIRDKTLPTVHGFGINNEGEYPASEYTKDGQRTTQGYYTWVHMISRCYSPVSLEKAPTYKGCWVNDDWKYYQNFAEFFYQDNYRQDGWHLEKDILIKGNREYGPNTCVFAPKEINALFNKLQNRRGSEPLGVSYKKSNGRYSSSCRNGNGILIHLGYFSNSTDAFYAFKEYKENLIKSVADDWSDKIDPRLYEGMYRYKIEITD